MRIKLFLVFVTLSTLACMEQVQHISVTATAAETSANPQPTGLTLENRVHKAGNEPNPTPGIIYVTAAETVYIRADHDYMSDIVGYLTNGKQVIVYECSGAWARIGAGRWVNSYYLSKQCK